MEYSQEECPCKERSDGSLTIKHTQLGSVRYGLVSISVPISGYLIMKEQCVQWYSF